MYRVAICEDEAVFAESQEKICRDILNKLEIESSITVYRGSGDFLTAFHDEGKRYELLLLDILMDGKDGMELAKLIRETDEDAAIIFITSSREYALQGYDVSALHYLVKPVKSDILERLIATDYRRRFQNKFFQFSSSTGQIRASLKEIIYMETVGRRVEVTLTGRTVYYAGKLNDLLRELPRSAFIQCHQAFAVNIANVLELTARDAIMVNGKSVPVSRAYAKAVGKAFVRQLQGR